MGTLTPPPGPEEPKRAVSPPSATGTMIYGGVFVVAAALIFILTLRPPPPPIAVPAVAAAPPPTPMPTLPLTYPVSRTVDAFDTYFGVKVADPYRWLEDGKSPEVKAWLAAQNQLTRSYLDPLPGRAALEKRYHDLLYVDTLSAPARAADRFFYMRRKASDEKAVLYWRSATDLQAPEQALIDPNQFIATNNAALGGWVSSYDGRRLAYTLKPNNADEATLYVKDVDSGQDLPGEVITGAKYADPSWLPDGSGFVYTYLPPADPGHIEDRPGLAVVRYHRLGTDPKNDPVLRAKTGDATKFVGAFVSRDGQWIYFVQENGWGENDLYYQPLKGQPTAAMAGKWKPIVVGKKFSYALYPWKGQGYILTNENAPRYRLYKVNLSDPRPSKWHEIVPQSPTAVLQDVSVIGDRLVLDKLEKVVSEVEVRDLDGKLIRKLDLPEPGSVGVAGEPDHNDLFYSFVNFTHPLEIFRTTVNDPAQALWAQVKVPIDPSPYIVEQKFFPSKDGTQIPMFIVHRRDIVMDGSTPFLLTGYGGFSVSETPYFSSGYYPWLEAGGGYAVVNLRGGGEFGEQWHKDGMLLKKQNVFDDCIAAGEFLVSQGYTKPERLAFRGGSNGGLLAGAMLTQRPDLFRAIICEVPLLDMIRFDQFGSGKTWVTEYGSPHDAAQFKALLAYSPYHHIKPSTAYPSVLFWTEEDDDRVDPMHARKMAAELQAATGSPHPILVRLETQGGHGGGDQVKKNIERGADVWGFLMHELRVKPPNDPPNQDVSN